MPSVAIARSLSPLHQFIEALEELEHTRDIERMLALFSDDCELRNLAIHPVHGKSGAIRFWHDYLTFFESIQTEFTRVTECGSLAFLEWASSGRFHSGKPLVYEGLTILEMRN